MKKILVLIAVTVGLGGFASAAVAAGCGGCGGDHGKATAQAEKKVTAQTTCPVMCVKINKKQYVDHGGKRIYVCCKGCIAKIEKDPKKYIEKLEKEGVTLDVTPAPTKEKKKDSHAGHRR